MKRIAISLMLAAVLVFSQFVPAVPKALAAEAAKKLILAMAVTPPNLVHISPYLAKDLGYFKEEGLDVEIVSFEGGVGSLRAMMAGSADVALTSADPPISARAQGASIRMIVSSSPLLEAVMTVQGSIKELKDLKEKKIGIQEPNGFADIFSRRLLAVAKIKPEEVQFISTSTAGRVPALVTGQVDTGVLHVEQSLRAIKRSPNLRNLVNFWEVFPDAFYNVIVAQEKTIKQKPDLVERFVRAVIKANRYIYKNKKGTLDAAAEVTGYSTDELGAAYDQLTKGRVFSVNEGMPRKMVQFNIDNLVKIGRLTAEKKPTYEQIVDLGPAEAALKTLGKWTDDPGWR
jgi:NitT/TauT family transport system substrate-binding protein